MNRTRKNRIQSVVVMWTALLSLSALLYFVHWLIFRDINHIFVSLIGEIAFLPVYVLIVSLVLEQVLHEQEKQQLLQKLNMVIGVFFSETGTPLLSSMTAFVPRHQELTERLKDAGSWSDREFHTTIRQLKHHEYTVDGGRNDLQPIREFLLEKRNFLLRLLENPNLLEHDDFTEMLRAVFHLAEELSFRNDMHHLPPEDVAHLSGDMKRAHSLLVGEWLAYAHYLKNHYPYLFSLAVRTNPFNPDASVIVTK